MSPISLRAFTYSQVGTHFYEWQQFFPSHSLASLSAHNCSSKLLSPTTQSLFGWVFYNMQTWLFAVGHGALYCSHRSFSWFSSSTFFSNSLLFQLAGAERRCCKNFQRIFNEKYTRPQKYLIQFGHQRWTYNPFCMSGCVSPYWIFIMYINMLCTDSQYSLQVWVKSFKIYNGDRFPFLFYNMYSGRYLGRNHPPKTIPIP